MGDQNKVVKFKKRRSINIGIVIFLGLFIYIAINVYIYFTKEQLTIYEVQEGSTAVDNKITALILRQETLVNSSKAGYLLYYQKDGSRVAKNESVFSISDNEIYSADTNDNAAIKLTKKNDTEIRHQIKNFRNSYSDNDYSKVYAFKDSAESTVLDILNNSMISDDKESAGTGVITSDQSGIITYYKDNYETVTPDNVTADMFQKANYKKTNLRTTDKISQNSPVYKLISSDTWNLVLPLTKDQYKKLVEADKKKLTITILEDESKITAGLNLVNKGSEYYAVLTMDKDMSNYIGERFLDVRIDFDSVKGLKIPNTAIVEKEFYEVPNSYFTQGGNSTKDGLVEKVTDKEGNLSTLFVPTDIYYEDDDYRYVDTKQFKVGTVIQSNGGEDDYLLSKTIKLSGVYNVNLGYAVFRRIEVLNQGKEYSIVSDHTSYGLSTYDHIVLDGKTAEDQKIIY